MSFKLLHSSLWCSLQMDQCFCCFVFLFLQKVAQLPINVLCGCCYQLNPNYSLSEVSPVRQTSPLWCSSITHITSCHPEYCSPICHAHPSTLYIINSLCILCVCMHVCLHAYVCGFAFEVTTTCGAICVMSHAHSLLL